MFIAWHKHTSAAVANAAESSYELKWRRIKPRYRIPATRQLSKCVLLEVRLIDKRPARGTRRQRSPDESPKCYLRAFVLPGLPIMSYTCTVSSSLSQNFSRLSKSTCVQHRSHREERKETRCGRREAARPHACAVDFTHTTRRGRMWLESAFPYWPIVTHTFSHVMSLPL